MGHKYGTDTQYRCMGTCRTMKSQLKYILAVCMGSLLLGFAALRGKLATDGVDDSNGEITIIS